MSCAGAEGPAGTGVQAPGGQLLPPDTAWVSPPSGRPGFVGGNHTPLHGNALALCCFGFGKGHCSPSVLDGRVTDCVGLVPPAQPRWDKPPPRLTHFHRWVDEGTEPASPMRHGDFLHCPGVKTSRPIAGHASPAQVTAYPPLLCREAGMVPAMGGVGGHGRRCVEPAPGPGPGSVGQLLPSPSPPGCCGQPAVGPGRAGRRVCSAELCPCGGVRRVDLVFVPGC